MQHSYVSLVMSKDLVLSWITQLKQLLTMCCHYFTILKVYTHSALCDILYKHVRNTFTYLITYLN